MEGTVLCAANHAPLTPISFLERTALVYPDRPAVVAAASGPTAAAPPPRTWRETRDRCLRLAAALAGLGVARHHVVKSRAPPPPPPVFFLLSQIHKWSSRFSSHFFTPSSKKFQSSPRLLASVQWIESTCSEFAKNQFGGPKFVSLDWE
jgi:acyl-CoA synthetase (AMP-forming)/AMP-acid ligase II